MNENLIFPTWHMVALDEEKQHAHFSTFLNKDLEHFQGHFPGFAVLPGVVQIDWAVRMARQYFQIPASGFCSMEHIKFQAIVLPETTLNLMLDWDSNRGRLSFSYRDSQKVCSSGRLSWRLDTYA